jgi:hypothetical protein
MRNPQHHLHVPLNKLPVISRKRLARAYDGKNAKQIGNVILSRAHITSFARAALSPGLKAVTLLEIRTNHAAMNLSPRPARAAAARSQAEGAVFQGAL